MSKPTGTMTKGEIVRELSSLLAAAPTRIELFAAKRRARIDELQNLLAGAADDLVPDPDPALESLLKRVAGGDRFDTRRRRKARL